MASFVSTPNQVLAECERQTSAKLSVKHIPLGEVEGFEAQMYEGTLYDTWDNESIGLDSNNLESLEVDVQRHVRGEGF